MDLSVLQPIAALADKASSGSRLVTLSIITDGIWIEGRDYILREGRTHPSTLKSEMIVNWQAMAVSGIEALERGIAYVVAALDHKKAEG